jgi:hypothetical protein
VAVDELGFDGIAGYVQGNQDRVRALLHRYYATDAASGGYTGRWFEYFSERSDPLHLDANDVAAAATLSVPLSGKVVAALFARAAEFDALLALSPDRDVTLWAADEAELADDAPLAQAYGVLRSIPGVGRVTASKLLACKRPHLVPIRDAVVETLLGAGERWWQPWKEVVGDERLRDTVEAVTPPVVPAGTSVLRRLDVILWMLGTAP